MIILVVAILLVVCVKVGADFLTKRTLKKVKINEVPISQVADGEYVGEAQIKPVSAKVNVQVENGKIDRTRKRACYQPIFTSHRRKCAGKKHNHNIIRCRGILIEE